MLIVNTENLIECTYEEMEFLILKGITPCNQDGEKYYFIKSKNVLNHLNELRKEVTVGNEQDCKIFN